MGWPSIPVEVTDTLIREQSVVGLSPAGQRDQRVAPSGLRANPHFGPAAPVLLRLRERKQERTTP